jgi:putative tryptophan/tyrosine transport system substrate-binding protein
VAVAGFTDPVAEGFAQSFNRPGGNVTGLATTPREMVDGKLMELLRDAQPELTRVAVLWDAGLGPVPEVQAAAAQTLGLHLQPIEVWDSSDLERAFEVAASGRIDGLVNAESPMLYLHHGHIAALATHYRLPSIALFREYAEAGGLMAYGPNLAALARRAAYYVDRILRGTRPADLPIEQPREFEFVVNLKTAQALGITFPNDIMLQVTEVLD